ncbi:MAG: hypothetical protein ABUJ98_15825 [Hyphomicrobium sp.]
MTEIHEPHGRLYRIAEALLIAGAVVVGCVVVLLIALAVTMS